MLSNLKYNRRGMLEMEVSCTLDEASHDINFSEHCQFEEYMCNACFRHHLMGKRNRNYELIDMNDPCIAARNISEEVEKCKQHNNKAIKFYCRKHESVGCGDCILSDHSTCKPEYIKDLSKNFQEIQDFIDLERKIEQLERESQANNENIKKNRKEFKGVHEEVLTEIRKFRTDINIYLDKAEATIISEMKQILSDNDKLLQNLGNNCSLNLSKIEDLKQTLDPTVHTENALFIQTVRSKAGVLEIEHELSKSIKSICEIKGYEFVPNQKLSSMIESRENLGKLNISKINENTRYNEITQLEMNVATLTFVEPRKQKKTMQQKTHRQTGVRRPYVYVGARVQAETDLDWFYHDWQKGTVTAVRPNGTVDVKWDDTGRTVCGYTVGLGPTSVSLI
ncbi:uncharacterized protein LOC123544260 [Mercenaria mercenaria]|uniref:uncharacterized protein LOC123544260 n=1 Tax=Mercenaria mercenaria TaxID=6596 RepID=UPI00234E3874|nr:uncharacterized protein LOC123544260 [Mercenaria mercenaria]